MISIYTNISYFLEFPNVKNKNFFYLKHTIYMLDLRKDKNLIKNENSFNYIAFFLSNRMYILYALIVFIVLNILFNPVTSATVLSNWINDFIGTFIKNLKIS